MDISNLQAFVSVAETGSFSRASEQLYITQPAVSKRIAALESELDTALFDRIGRQISLTESGQMLLPRARHILLEIEDSRRILRNLSGHVGGCLKIGTSHHIGLHHLPAVLQQFTVRYPAVELDLHFMKSEEACKAIHHGDLELGVITLPLKPDADLHMQKLWPDPMAVVVGETHPLYTCALIETEHLLTYPAILPERGTYTRELIERSMTGGASENMPEIKVRMATHYLESIKMLVSVGLGWSVLPRTMLSDELRVLGIAGLNIQRELGVVWHARRSLSNAAKKMIAALGLNNAS
ncbi:MAG TPA: LysR family transcriptional regulator [Gammaproteobacteria bacterium]|nr:LysR family transcriptional regulator [Gammaproteobacteria bacterium]